MVVPREAAGPNMSADEQVAFASVLVFLSQSNVAVSATLVTVVGKFDRPQREKESTRASRLYTDTIVSRRGRDVGEADSCTLFCANSCYHCVCEYCGCSNVFLVLHLSRQHVATGNK